MVNFTISSNMRQMENVYRRRADYLGRTSRKLPQEFAVLTKTIRAKNIKTMVYDKTPYKTKGDLYNTEVAINGVVYNSSPIANKRMQETGNYKGSSVLKDANWGKASLIEAMPIVRKRATHVNQSVWRISR